MGAEPVYTSRIRIKRLEGPIRLAHLPIKQDPITFGIHSEIAEHYGLDPDKYPPFPATLDYVVASAGG